MEHKQDVFISHASADKERYISALTRELDVRRVTYWLDTLEIGWGDVVVEKINDGLRDSRFLLLCLSGNFLKRPWTEAEMSAAIDIQINGRKRVLPLILDDKELVLRHYPLISRLAYKEFSTGPARIAEEIARLFANPNVKRDGMIHVRVESAHTGELCNLDLSPSASVEWLLEKAKLGLSVRDTAHAGAFEQISVRWNLVDVKVEKDWKQLPYEVRFETRAMVEGRDGLRTTEDTSTRLSELGVDDTVFHLYGFPEREQQIMFCMAK
jgi:hypothetical protein